MSFLSSSKLMAPEYFRTLSPQRIPAWQQPPELANLIHFSHNQVTVALASRTCQTNALCTLLTNTVGAILEILCAEVDAFPFQSR